MNKTMTLSARDLCCIRQNKLLFKNISFDLAGGEALLIEGPNGSGKSSLLRLLTGLATPSQGNIFWQNKSLEFVQTEYSEQMHYIGHANGIKLGLTVAENLQLINHLSSNIIDLEAVLTLLQLSEHKNTLTKNLSAGQRRRVALAKLFLLPKPLWILDEPFTALDITTQNILLSKLESHLHDGGMTIISSHHSIHLEKHKPRLLRLGEC